MGALRDAFELAKARAAAKKKNVQEDVDGDAPPRTQGVTHYGTHAAIASTPPVTYKHSASTVKMDGPVTVLQPLPAGTTSAKRAKAPKNRLSRREEARLMRRVDQRMALEAAKRQIVERRRTYPQLTTSVLESVYRPGRSVRMESGSDDLSAMEAQPMDVEPTLQLRSDARVIPRATSVHVQLLDSGIEDRGRALSHIVGTPVSKRELVLGLDFGSSSTKMVICDRAADTSYVVAVSDGAGIRRYLMPTAIRNCNGRYTLDGEGAVYTGLKSDLLASPDNVDLRERVVAYLALVIRRARGWLFAVHEDVYRDVPIVWTLTVGIPKQQGETSRHFDLYKRLAISAWQVAAEPGAITTQKVAAALRHNEPQPSDDETVEVRVIPEIAAEIYGFVSSESFDPHGRNIFLMVDVGGRTVDASLFHVKRGKANRWAFSFYTSVVRPLGAIELHMARIDWWNEMLLKGACGEIVDRLSADLETLKRQSVFEEVIPATADDYLDGAVLEPGLKDEQTPDYRFRAGVRETVRQKVFGDAIDVQVYASQMVDEPLPYFLCGGGSRMPLYSSAVNGAMMQRGSSPLFASLRTLRVPVDLQAPGVRQAEYDRFAVAYGLGQLDVASVIDTEPLPPRNVSKDPFHDRFVNKDMC